MKKLTLTGIDNTVSTDWMKQMIRDYPGLEFGILRSPTRAGHYPRYPAENVIDYISSHVDRHGLAFHLCGEYAQMVHASRWADLVRAIEFNQVSRVQVNSKEDNAVAVLQLQSFSCFIGLPLIMQWRRNDMLPYFAALHILQDRSGGRGEEETVWFRPDDLVYKAKMPIGYAGGLNPDNIEHKIREIRDVARGMPFWIDCESGIRTDDIFDIKKAEAMAGTVLGKRRSESF